MKKQVSVYMPAYNAAEFLARDCNRKSSSPEDSSMNGMVSARYAVAQGIGRLLFSGGLVREVPDSGRAPSEMRYFPSAMRCLTTSPRDGQQENLGFERRAR